MAILSDTIYRTRTSCDCDADWIVNIKEIKESLSERVKMLEQENSFLKEQIHIFKYSPMVCPVCGHSGIPMQHSLTEELLNIGKDKKDIVELNCQNHKKINKNVDEIEKEDLKINREKSKLRHSIYRK